MKRDIVVMFLTILFVILCVVVKNKEWFIMFVSILGLIGWGLLYRDLYLEAKKGNKESKK
mgnify:CR=1 FL=1